MAHPTGVTKNADAKGRVTLGNAFANRTVIVEHLSAHEVRVILARVIPEREAWLYQNPKALSAVRRGLTEAREGKFAGNPPDLKSDSKFTSSIPDEA